MREYHRHTSILLRYSRDAVYGLTDFTRDDCEAEYTITRPAEIAPKPISVDYIQAAAVPLSALTAMQALFKCQLPAW